MINYDKYDKYRALKRLYIYIYMCVEQPLSIEQHRRPGRPTVVADRSLCMLMARFFYFPR